MNRKNTTTKGGRIVLILLSLLLMAVGFALESKAYNVIRETQESTGWPTTMGQITQSELRVSEGDSKLGEMGSRNSQTRTKTYSAFIEYEFEVDGVMHRGNRVSAVQEMLGDQSHAQAILTKYPINQQVRVAYHPEYPNRTVLEPGSLGGAIVMLILELCFAVPPLFLLRIVWNTPLKQE